VPLSDLPRLRACYWTAKDNASVITRRTAELDDIELRSRAQIKASVGTSKGLAAVYQIQ